MRNIIALPLFFLLFPASLQAQLMTGVEAYSQEICIGETLQFNGQLFRWPITVEPLFIRDSDGREWDPDAEVSPEGTSVYTFYYRLRDGHDTLSEQAEVVVFEPPYLEIGGMEPGVYCPETLISCHVDSVANNDGPVRWTLSTGMLTETGDSCSFLLEETCRLFVRASNEHCPIEEKELVFEMVPYVTFETDEVLFREAEFRTCVSCGFALPEWDDLVERAADGDIVAGRTEWSDGPAGEKTVSLGWNTFPVKVFLTIEKRNACDTARLQAEKEVLVRVEGLDCTPEIIGGDMSLYPCHEGIVRVEGRQDTSYVGKFFDCRFSVSPDWPGLSVREADGVYRHGETWHEWGLQAPDCGGNYGFDADFHAKYTLRCPWSEAAPVRVDSLSFSSRIAWDTNRMSFSYIYCDRTKARLELRCRHDGMVIEEVRIGGVAADSLELVIGEPGQSSNLSYQSVWTVRDSIDRNYEKYENISLWVVISRQDGACFYRDTVEQWLHLEKGPLCQPYFSRDMASCYGDLSRVSYVSPLDYIVVDSVAVGESDFLLDVAYEAGSAIWTAAFRSYFPNSLETGSRAGKVKVTGYAHDKQTGKRYKEELQTEYVVGVCPPVFHFAFDEGCNTGCLSCPGAGMEVTVRVTNPSTDWDRTRVEWRKPPKGSLKEKIFDDTFYPAGDASYPYNWREFYHLYQESDFVLSITYNEGDSVRVMDSVPLPMSRFRVDSGCAPRFEVHRDSCCGSDSIHWYVYSDYYRYYLEEAGWEGSVSEVFPVGSGVEGYYYDYAPEDYRPRLHYHTRAEAPGLYPYTVRYAVNDTVLSYSDTLRIAVAGNPKVFLQDTVYVCTGSDVDVARYIDSSMVESLVGISSPDDLVLRNLTANRIFPLTAKMKYTCDLGDEMTGELFIIVEQDVYLDFDASLREVCPLDSTELRVSTNGRVTWLKQCWQGGAWSEADTLCRESRNRLLYDRMGCDRVRYTVVAANSCQNPPSLSGTFEAVRLPSVRIHFSDTTACYPDSIRPQTAYSGIAPLPETGIWIVDGVRYGQLPVLPPSSDTVCLIHEVQSANSCWSVDTCYLFNHFPPVLEWQGEAGDGDAFCVRKGEESVLSVHGADTYAWEFSPGTFPFQVSGGLVRFEPEADFTAVVEGVDQSTGCRSSDTIAVYLYPDLLPDPDTVICYLSPLRLQAPRDSSATYEWLRAGERVGDGFLEKDRMEYADTGVYWLAGRRYSCRDTQACRISFFPVPEREFSGEDSVCEGDALFIAYENNAGILYPGQTRFRWKAPSGEELAPWESDTVLFRENMRLADGGWYSVELEYGVCSLSDSLRVGIVPLPRPLWPADTFYCEGESLLLDASNPDFPGSAYRWSTGSEDAEERIAVAGSYWVDMDFLGCRQRTGIEVAEHGKPYLGLSPDTLACRGEMLVLSVPEGYEFYRWFRPGSFIDEGNGPEWACGDSLSAAISVEVFHNGCWNSDTVFVERYFCGRIYFASAFTPDGDGMNDRFGPISFAWPEEVAYELAIFNRNGQEVFHSTDVRESWDGTFKGKECPPGLYTYRCRAEVLRTGRDLSSGGNLWLIR